MLWFIWLVWKKTYIWLYFHFWGWYQTVIFKYMFMYVVSELQYRKKHTKTDHWHGAERNIPRPITNMTVYCEWYSLLFNCWKNTEIILDLKDNYIYLLLFKWYTTMSVISHSMSLCTVAVTPHTRTCILWSESHWAN